MKNFDELNAELEKFQQEFMKKGEIKFKEIAKEIFDEFPEVNSFSWTQYTPYFNDGEECVFGVNGLCALNGFDEYDYDEESEGDGENIYQKAEENNAEGKKAKKIIKVIEDFISSAPEDLLKAIFDDHCKVTIYRNKPTDVEEYEHD